MSRVSRSTKPFTTDELNELAALLGEMFALRTKLLNKLSGRALVRWIDPLLSFMSGFAYFEKLRSALDDEWYAIDPSQQTSPFYGTRWDEDVE